MRRVAPASPLTEVAELRAKLVGYEAFKAARTEAEEGDDIWQFYDGKLWRQIVAANEHIEKLEAALENATAFKTREALNRARVLLGKEPL